MKKLLTIAALVLFSAQAMADTIGAVEKEAEDFANSYKSVDIEPPRAIAGTMVSPIGNTVKYTSRALGVLMAGGNDLVMAAVDSGQCAMDVHERSAQPGELAACAIRFGGDVLLVVGEAATYTVLNAVEFVAEATTDLTGLWADAFRACDAELGAVLGTPCRVIAVILDTAGAVVSATAYTVVEVAGTTWDSTSYALTNAVSVPVNLFKGDLSAAGRAAYAGGAGAACTVAEIFFGWIRLIDSNYKSCIEYAREDVRDTFGK